MAPQSIQRLDKVCNASAKGAKELDRRQQAQVNDQAMAHYQADLGRYSQAFAVCMQGQGYTVR